MLVPMVVIGVALALDRWGAFSDAREYVQGRSIPARLARSGRTGREIRLLEHPLADLRLAGMSEEAYERARRSVARLAEEVVQSPVPALTVVVDPDDLSDRYTGLDPNYDKRGRNWERPAYVSYSRDGELRFVIGAGLRVHGGTSRRKPPRSYRLHLRDLYGTPRIPPGVLFDGAGDPIRSLVIHNDVRGTRDGYSMRFVNPLAYDLASAIGCHVTRTQPVRFYLNGVYQGPYVLTEHISPDLLKARFGHGDFVIIRTKGHSRVGRRDRELFNELREWAVEAQAPLTMHEVESRVDLMNLSNWFISILFSGVTDPFQGAAVLDKTVSDAKWFWINWDMDHAFRDVYGEASHPWELDMFAIAKEYHPASEPRAHIFYRLLSESPEYRAFFLGRLAEVLNHILTPAFLRERIAYYERTSNSLGIVDQRFLESMGEYLEKRPAALRAQMSAHLQTAPAYRLSVRSSVPGELRVDGHGVGEDYTGWYFAESPATIEITGQKVLSPGEWLVNGEPVAAQHGRLELNLSSDTRVVIAPAGARGGRPRGGG